MTVFADFEILQLVRLRQCVAKPNKHTHTHTYTLCSLLLVAVARFNSSIPLCQQSLSH